jgi:hypothetical protein
MRWRGIIVPAESLSLLAAFAVASIPLGFIARALLRARSS